MHVPSRVHPLALSYPVGLVGFGERYKRSEKSPMYAAHTIRQEQKNRSCSTISRFFGASNNLMVSGAMVGYSEEEDGYKLILNDALSCLAEH